MSNIQHAPRPGEDYTGEVAAVCGSQFPALARRPARWSVRRRRDAWFLLLALLVGTMTIVALSGGISQHPTQAQGAQPVRAPQTQPGAPSATPATGTFREYPLPQAHVGLMRLTIDHEGRLWFGEMGRNYLAVFDPRTQTFQQWTPPGGQSGIMGIQVAPDDTIWFAEQYANYIGHYFPATGRYQLYPLPTITVPDLSHAGKTLTLPSAPNDLALDAHGNAWFTELNADALGRLDTHTGLISQYPLSAKRSVQTLDPYGVAIDPQGMVWFTELSNDHVGRLDPTTGGTRLFTPSGPNVALMEIASDPRGTIWATSFTANLLLSLNPRTGTFTAYHVPSTGGRGAGALYGLAITPDDGVWVTVSAENAIARLDVAAPRFISYRIPTDASLPLGIVVGANHTLWFTEAGSDKVGMLRP